MLTDYHLHLRPDQEGTPAHRYFTAANVERYLAAASEAGVDEVGVSEHVYRFTEALTIWRHPFWESSASDDLAAYCDFVRATPLKLGLECDFISGAEEQTASLLEGHDFDYVVGSVHFLGERAVDHDGWDVWEVGTSPDQIWTSYFEALARCARSGLFDILAHPDLVKSGEVLDLCQSAIFVTSMSRRSRRSLSPALPLRSQPPDCESPLQRYIQPLRFRQRASRRGRFSPFLPMPIFPSRSALAISRRSVF